jgi:hypothetical protein
MSQFTNRVTASPRADVSVVRYDLNALGRDQLRHVVIAAGAARLDDFLELLGIEGEVVATSTDSALALE